MEFVERGGYIHGRGPQAQAGEAGRPGLGRGGHQATLKRQSHKR
jgi:hypothetical protein